MKLQIENVRSIDALLIELTPGEVTELAKPNGFGKSTAAACLAACLARNPDPMYRGPARRVRYVRDGADPEDAVAVLSGDDWSITWLVASGQFPETGSPPPRPPAIVGHAMRAAWEGKDDDIARAWLEALLSGAVTQDEIRDEIANTLGKDVPDATTVAQKLAEDIIANPLQGWDTACDYCETRMREAKRDWSKIVASDGQHEQFGDKKAPKWRPRAWRAELEGTNVPALEQLQHQMQERVNAARDRLSVIDGKIEQQSERNEQIRATTKRLSDMQDEHDALADDIERAHADPGGPTDDERQAARRRLDEAEAAYQAVRTPREGDAEMLEAQNYLSSAQADQSQCERDFRNKQRDVQDLDDEVKRLGRQIADAENIDDVCPHCKQPMPPEAMEHARDHLAHLQGRHTDATARLGDLVADFQQTRRALEEVKERVGKARAKVSAMQDAASRREVGVAAKRRAYDEALDAWRGISEASAESGGSELARELAQKRARIAGQIEELRSSLRDQQQGMEQFDRGPAEAAVHKAVDHVRQVETGLVAFKCHQSAQAQVKQAAVWGRVAKALSPTGIRADRMGERVEKVNKILAMVREQCDLPAIELRGRNPKMYFDRRDVGEGSASEQWLVAAVLRAVVCVMHEAPVAVMDASDALQTSTRERLRRTVGQLAKGTGIAVLWTEWRE